MYVPSMKRVYRAAGTFKVKYLTVCEERASNYFLPVSGVLNIIPNSYLPFHHLSSGL